MLFTLKRLFRNKYDSFWGGGYHEKLKSSKDVKLSLVYGLETWLGKTCIACRSSGVRSAIYGTYGAHSTKTITKKL
jgi:hypothetical protein